MISAIRCGEKCTCISISVSIIGQISCKISAYRILAKNPISCIPTWNVHMCDLLRSLGCVWSLWKLNSIKSIKSKHEPWKRVQHAAQILHEIKNVETSYFYSIYRKHLSPIDCESQISFQVCHWIRALTNGFKAVFSAPFTKQTAVDLL